MFDYHYIVIWHNSLGCHSKVMLFYELSHYIHITDYKAIYIKFHGVNILLKLS